MSFPSFDIPLTTLLASGETSKVILLYLFNSFLGLTEETGTEKPSTNSLDSNSSVKLSSNKRSHSHVRKNARPTRARVGSKRSHTSNSFLGQEASNNNSDEDVMEVSSNQQTLTVNPSPFNSLPSPSKRPFLLRPTNVPSHVTEGNN